MPTGLALALLAAAGAFAQAPTPAPVPAAKAWEFSASLSNYLLPDARDYLQPSFAADRGRLHLEGRYQYEGLETGSLWLGWNFSGGDAVLFELTPMVGAVFGDTDGVAPGYRAALAWRRLDFATEGLYLFAADESGDDFFYNWSELGWSPLEWLRLGFVVQRTRVYETEFDIDRGFFAGLAWRDATFTTYVLNPDDDPTVVLAAAVSF